MTLYATIKNERKGKKSTGDDTRILITLSYKNKEIGTLGLYSITDEGNDLGYRLVWDNEPFPKTVIREEEKGKRQKGELCEDCGAEMKMKGGYGWYCPECWGDVEPHK